MSSARKIKGEGVEEAGSKSLGCHPTPHLDPESVEHTSDICTGRCTSSFLLSDCSCFGIQFLQLFQESGLCHWCLQNCPG